MKINEILNEDGVIVPGVNTTVDVKLGQTEKEAKKFFGGNGKPKPIGVPGATPNQAFNLGLTESSNLVLTRANIIPYIKDILADYLDQERDINKLNNMLRLLVGRQIKAHGKRYEITKEDVSIAIAQLNEIENAGGQGVKKDDTDRYDFDSMIGAAEPSGERIGKYEIWVIEDDNDDFVLLIKDPNSEGFLGEFRLQHDSNTGTHKSTVFFDKEIQGLGMGPRLYEFAIKKWKKTIVSDYQQSTGSKMLWAKLAKIPGVFVYAWNPKTDEFFQWDPAADPDEDVYFDTEQNTKLQSELFKINLALRKGEYDGDEQHKNLIKMAKAKAAEIDQLSHAHGKDIRLVATAEQKSK